MVTIELIEESANFAALEAEWDELRAASAARGPFLAWAWLHTWWTHLAGSRRLAIIAVRDGGQLIAIAPLSLAQGRLPWFWRYEFLGTGFAGSDYLDVIARRGRELHAVTAISDFIRVQRPALHLAHLPQSSLASLLALTLAPPSSSNGWTVREHEHGVCPFIRLEGHTWDSYLATLGPAHRATVRRRISGLNKKFQAKFEAVTGEGARAQAMDALFGFHEQRWRNRGGSSAFSTAPLRAFHHDVTRRMLDGRTLRLYTLRVNDAVAAVMYGFVTDNRFYFYQHGFDAQYMPQSIGLVLMGLTIQAAIAEGLKEFDMLFGDEPYKSLWTSERRPLIRLELFPSHFAGRLHRHSVEAESSVRTFAKRMLAHGS